MSTKHWLWIITAAVIISTIIDFWSAIKSPAFELAEVNPIYVLSGSITITLITVAVITYYALSKLWRSINFLGIYVYTYFALFLIVGHFGGAYTNVLATQVYVADPQTFIEAHQGVSVVEKVADYGRLLFIFMMLPFVVAVLSYLLSMKRFFETSQDRVVVIEAAVRKCEEAQKLIWRLQ